MEIKFDSKVKIEKINEDTGIHFSDQSNLFHFHYQDCCESVYASWGNLHDQTCDILIDGFSTEIVDQSGINILLYPNFANKHIYIRLFVPCYNSQNGYYSSDLSLVFVDRYGKEFTDDISDAAYPDIN